MLLGDISVVRLKSENLNREYKNKFNDFSGALKTRTVQKLESRVERSLKNKTETQRKKFANAGGVCRKDEKLCATPVDLKNPVK